jgi:hypothetical protein
MNEQLFDEQVGKTRLTERSKAMARAILVDGRTPGCYRHRKDIRNRALTKST